MFCMTASADAALPEETPLAGVDKKMPMLELLPVGSTLTKVSVTEYAGPRLSLLMTASSMTVVAPHEAAGKTLNIYLYGKTARLRTCFPVTPPTSWTGNWSSRARKPPSGRKISPPGVPGLYLDTETRRGILLGPGKTIIHVKNLNK